MIVVTHTSTIHAKWHTTGWSHWGSSHRTATHGRTSTVLKASTLEHSASSSWEVTPTSTKLSTTASLHAATTTHLVSTTVPLVVTTTSPLGNVMLLTKAFLFRILIVISYELSSFLPLQFGKDNFLECIVMTFLAFSFFLGLSPGLKVLLRGDYNDG